MESNTIHSTVREGSTLYMPDNQEHADALCEVLNGRSCARLIEAQVVSGPGFEEKAAIYNTEQELVDESGGQADMPVLEEPKTDEVVEESKLNIQTGEDTELTEDQERARSAEEEVARAEARDAATDAIPPESTPWDGSKQAPGLAEE